VAAEAARAAKAAEAARAAEAAKAAQAARAAEAAKAAEAARAAKATAAIPPPAQTPSSRAHETREQTGPQDLTVAIQMPPSAPEEAADEASKTRFVQLPDAGSEAEALPPEEEVEQPTPLAEAAPTRPVQPRTSAKGVPWAAVAAIGLLVVGGVSFYLWSGSAPRKPEAPQVLALDEAVLGNPDRHLREDEVLHLAAAVKEAGKHPGVTFEWFLDGQPRSKGASWDFRPGFDEGGRTRTVRVIATEGALRAQHEWQVAVTDVPRKPVIASADPAPGTIEVPPGGVQRFTIQVTDPDAGKASDLTIVWSRNGKPVATGSESSWTLTNPTDEDEVRVMVSKGGTLSADPKAWQIAVAKVPPTTIPPVAENHAPTLRDPKPSMTQLVAVAEGGEVEFRARADDQDKGDRLSWTWFLDGKPVGDAPSWKFKAPAAAAGSHKYRVEVEVADQAAAKAPRLAWNVEVKPAPPRIVDFEPRNRSVTIEPGQPMDFSVTVARSDAGDVRYEWRVDSKPRDGAGGSRFRLPGDLPAGSHVVEVTLVDADGLRSPAQRWTVVAALPPPQDAPPPTTVAVAPPLSTTPPPTIAASGVSREEARAWIDRVRAAWAKLDVPTLVALGDVPGDKSDALTRAIAGYKNGLQVTIHGESIDGVDATGATVSYDRTDTDGATGKKLALPRQVRRLERGRTGAVTVRR
jgi:hypothetical protein